MLELALEYLKCRKLKYKEYYDLSATSSIRVGGVARLFVEPKNKTELCELLISLSELKIPYRVIGGLTNTLIATDLYRKVVISTRKLTAVTCDDGVFTVDAGVSLAALMSFASRLGYGGAEPLWLIPGTVGAALVGNSGAHGVEMSDIVLGADVLAAGDFHPGHLSVGDMCFSYRDSIFKHKDDITVLTVTLALNECDREESLHRRKSILELRRSTQPVGLPSLGSVFKRVRGVGAGYYVEKAGLKGLRIGGAEVSRKHAGFIINSGGAVWRDVAELISTVRSRVSASLGVELEPEVQILD